MEPLSGKILGATERATYFFGDIENNLRPSIFIDIIIVAVIFYWIYIFLRETRAMRILYGLFTVVVLMALGRLFDFVLLNWLLKNFMTMLVVAIPIVFQPELRTALEKLGRTKFLGELAFSKEESKNVVEQITKVAAIFSEKRVGALIVLRRQTGLAEYIENGIRVDAKVSAEILSSIFFPKSPLHDGAVIIGRNRVVCASATLPVSQTEMVNNLGTRHKAGLGITENSDAVSVIVSEETGNISFAVGGRIDYNITPEKLRNRLNGLFRK